MEINFRVDRKITLIDCKTISGFILLENNLHLSYTLSSFSHEHSKLNEHANAGHHSMTQFVLLLQSVLLMLVRAPLQTHSSPIHPRWVRSTLYFTPRTSPDLRSTLYSVWSSHLTFDPHTSDPSSTKADPPIVFPSIFLSLISDFFFFFFVVVVVVVVVWVVVFWWFFYCVVVVFVWIVVDFVWVMVDFVI